MYVYKSSTRIHGSCQIETAAETARRNKYTYSVSSLITCCSFPPVATSSLYWRKRHSFLIGFILNERMKRRHEMSGLLLNLLLIVTLFGLANTGSHGGHKHVIIYVPYKIKTIHHTHTITKHIHHGGGDKYQVLGYTVGHPIGLGGHDGGGGGGGGGFGGGGHDFSGGHDFGGGGGGHDFGGSGGGHDFGDGGGGHDFGGGSGGHNFEGGSGGHDFGGGGGHDLGGGGGGGHFELSGDDHGGSGYDFGGGLGNALGGGHDWSHR